MLIMLLIYYDAATTSTFIRFFPKIKRRYDYVFLIFILTFSFISVLGFREETHIIEIAHKRMSTVAIGIVVTVLINILIYPIWAGQELHNSIALNMEKIGQCLQGITILGILICYCFRFFYECLVYFWFTIY